MNFDMFQSALADEVRRLVADPSAVSVQLTRKNNGRQLHALCIRRPGSRLSPMIYLEDFYRRYQQGIPLTHLAKLLLLQYQELPDPASPLLESFKNWERAKADIYCKLVNYGLNEPFLLSVPHKRFLDLAVLYYYRVDPSLLPDATVTISNSHLSLWHITADELHHTAWSNTLAHFPSKLQSMAQTLTALSGDCASPSHTPAMYVLSNTQNFLGAICLLYPDALKEAARLLASDLYILPSSIHECILLPQELSFSRSALRDMVETINQTQLEPEEILSDQVYLYSRENASLTL